MDKISFKNDFEKFQNYELKIENNYNEVTMQDSLLELIETKIQRLEHKNENLTPTRSKDKRRSEMFDYAINLKIDVAYKIKKKMVGCLSIDPFYTKFEQLYNQLIKLDEKLNQSSAIIDANRIKIDEWLYAINKKIL